MNNQRKVVGDYQYIPRFCLGEGGFGKVYHGENINTGE